MSQESHQQATFCPLSTTPPGFAHGRCERHSHRSHQPTGYGPSGPAAAAGLGQFRPAAPQTWLWLSVHLSETRKGGSTTLWTTRDSSWPVLLFRKVLSTSPPTAGNSGSRTWHGSSLSTSFCVGCRQTREGNQKKGRGGNHRLWTN